MYNRMLTDAPAMKIPVKVAVRVRPLIPADRLQEVVCINAFPYANQVVLGSQNGFTVDFALPMNYSQSQVFDTAIYSLVNCLLEGYDTSVIAYGQTGSGKTYTIIGPGLHCASSETEYGAIPRVTRELFTRLMQITGRRFQVKVTFIEICDETIRDLLNTSQFQRDLTLVEDQDGSTIVAGAEQIECQSISEVFNCLHVGMSNRHAGWTTVRPRAHSIFTLSLEQHWIADGVVHQTFSRAQFTELAGSEKPYFMETAGELHHHDTGLLALGNVISMLSNPQWDYSTIPFNQSILTTLLRDSFGGRANTLLICCVSPGSMNYDDTLNSLRFCLQARNIYNFPTVNAYHSRNLQFGFQAASEEPFTDEVLESNEGSTNADTFGLEFAASQWLKLVANAEGLFAQLMGSKCLSEVEREQVERWLCLKQECEECVGSDDAASVKEFAGRILERIDELTESDEKTDTSVDLPNICNGVVTKVIEKSHCESESESDVDSQRPDFLDKLDDLIQKFRISTDVTVREKEDLFDPTEFEVKRETPVEERNNNFIPRIAINRNCMSGRRKSIHPGSEIPNLALPLNHEDHSPSEDFQSDVKNVPIPEVDDPDNQLQCLNGLSQSPSSVELNERPFPATSPLPGPCQELKLLSAGNETRQSQIRQVLVDLEGAQKRIEELQYTIQIKEQCIADMIKNSDMRASAKQRFQRKRSKLEEEYYKTRTHLAHAENAFLLTTKDNALPDERQRHKKEIEKYKNLAMHYEKRLKDIEMIKQIAGDSARKVLDLENSLQTSRRQMEKLKKQLKKEEKHKHSLEQELLEDQRKIKELELKYNLQTSKLNDKEPEDKVEAVRLKWIQEEEERVMTMRESSQRFQEQLLQQQSMLEKREAFLKEKLSKEKSKTKSFVEVSARISHLEQVLKEKSTDLERAEDIDEKEALRHEIRNLRRTRDCLVDQRCDLDEKYQKEKSLTTVEERKLLECDEAIEAIDAAIEYKNELICGRKGQGLDNTRVQREKGEELLLARLMKLSPMEMRTLLYKYFQKAIDLRESGRKMEVQLAELEHHTETQAWKIQALSNALQQAHFEAERRIVVLQKEHQEKLHLMLRHFAEESSQSSGPDRDPDVGKIRRENNHLKRRVHEMESLLLTASRVRRRSRSISPVTIPHQNLKQLQGPESPPTTKVTRQKNKLIIQQHKAKKSHKELV